MVQQAVKLMKEKWNIELLKNFPTMNKASICGLGQAAPNPLQSIIKHLKKILLNDKFKLNGNEITAKDESIWQAAKNNNIKFPHLCHVDEVGMTQWKL